MPAALCLIVLDGADGVDGARKVSGGVCVRAVSDLGRVHAGSIVPSQVAGADDVDGARKASGGVCVRAVSGLGVEVSVGGLV